MTSKKTGTVPFALLLFSFFVILSACSSSEKSTPEKRPNIIYIMADDHANRTISAFGAGINNTPNIDRIANEGAFFTNSFCANSICGPSRAAILTGMHGHKNGVMGNGEPWDSTQMVFPRLLKQAGYQTALIGKWHLNSKPADEFDYYKILVGAGKQGFYYNPEFFSSDKGTETMMGYSTDLVTSEAIKWLQESRNGDQPFCLFIQYKAPHVPRMPPLRQLEKYLNDSIPEPPTLQDDLESRSYYAKQVNFFLDNYRPLPAYGTYDPTKNIYLDRMTQEELKAYHQVIDPQNEEYQALLESGALDDPRKNRSYVYQRFIKDYLRIVDVLDENIGKVLNWLDEEEELKQNTLIVYTSDQSYFTGEHGYAEKRLMYEPALRMPLMMRWPNRIKAGTKVEELIQNIDYGPTFLDAAGVPVPPQMQGKSFLPLIGEEPTDDWRQAIYYHYYDHGRHKVGRHHGIRSDKYKLIHFYTDDVYEFYDLEEDPNELNNLYGKADYEEKIGTLKQELDNLRKYYEVPDSHFVAPYMIK